MKNSILLAAVSLAAALPLSAAAASGDFTDGQIVGVVDAANQGELDAAGIASGKAQNQDVKDFADHMLKEHGDAKQQLLSVETKASLTAADSDLGKSLTRHGADEAGFLGNQTGDAFDRAYIDGQVADHAQLLKELDDRLIPGAQDSSLAALLRKLRPTVASHLQKARRIQAELAREQ